jgi:hypothetical protein
MAADVGHGLGATRAIAAAGVLGGGSRFDLSACKCDAQSGGKERRSSIGYTFQSGAISGAMDGYIVARL